MEPKYNYYQVVEIIEYSSNEEPNNFNNQKKVMGFVAGISQGEEKIIYAIKVFGESEVICFSEERIIGHTEYI